MAACEVCWERAQQDVLLRGGSVVDRYMERLNTSKDHERIAPDEQHVLYDELERAITK